MLSIQLVLLILALVCFVCAAVNVQSPKVSLTPLGLALWVLSVLIR